MDISSISSVQPDYEKQALQKKQKNEKSEYTKDSVAQKKQTDRYDAQGTMISKTEALQNEEEKKIADKEEIRKQIWRQTYTLLYRALNGTEAFPELEKGLVEASKYIGEETDPIGLGDYFANNSEDWEKVQNGIVPEYFGVEKTAQRILDIWVPKNPNGPIDVDYVKGYINQAYSEVAQMFGGKLPQLVLDTQQYIMERLDEYETDNETVEDQ